MRRVLVLAALALAAVPSALADPPRSGIVHVPRAAGKSKLDWGKALFGGNCVTCHGPNGAGIEQKPGERGAGDVPGLGPSLRGVGELSADFYLRTGYMPVMRADVQPQRERPLLRDDEIDALVAYVGSLGNGPAIPTPHPERGNLAQGLQLFTQHCAGCHQIVGQGGYVVGARAVPLNRASAVQIAEAVRIGPYVMPSFSEKRISNRELDSIVRYVRERVDHPDDRGGWAIGHVGPVPEGLVTWFLAIAAIVGTCMLIGKRVES